MKNKELRIENKESSRHLTRQSFAQQNLSGFTLIEIIIGIGVFSIIASGVYVAYFNLFTIIASSRFNTTATYIADSEVEIVRNMNYEEIGIIDGVPSGLLSAQKTITIDGVPFIVNTTVRSIDDPFDGTIGGNPNDTAPADYKLVEFRISCQGCDRYLPVEITTTVAPSNLENTSNNGALFMNVIDASGLPINGATVTIINNIVTPSINLTDTTNINGQLQLVDTATSSEGYSITITKGGYSFAQTYTSGAPENPNPLQPHATVAQQQVTGITFAIDKTSTLGFTTQNIFCAPVQSVDYLQTGAKLIGTSPDVPKFQQQFITGSTGTNNLPSLEWDDYTFTNLDDTFDITGTTTPTQLTIDPGNSIAVTWNVAPKAPESILVIVRDPLNQPISDAVVNVTGGSVDITRTTGRRTFKKTDWTGGTYDSKSAYIDTDSVPGMLTLMNIGGKYPSQSEEWLISSTIDMGTPELTLYTASWNPDQQPISAGPDSIRIQIAVNNDNTTWNFTGPDGTVGTYYTVASGSDLHGSMSNNRYLRYKVYLKTLDDMITPSLEDVEFSFSSSCFPNDQVFFSDLSADTYTLTITKSGYELFSDPTVILNTGWKQYDATLIPQ